MHILYLYQFYHTPDAPAAARHYTYVRALARRHRITLVTAATYLEARLAQNFEVVPEGVDLRVLDVPYANEMRAGRRARAYAAYALKAVAAGLGCRRPDLVFGVSPPLTVGWAARLLARLKGVPWVFELKDLWPDFPIQMGAVGSPWLQRRLYALEAALYRSAAHVVTLSTDMEAHVRRRGIPPERVTTLVHGAELALVDACRPGDLDALRARHGLTGKKVVLYGGSFGRANDIPTLLDAAARLAHRDDVRFVFAGFGYHEPALREAAGRAANVLLLPPQPLPAMLCWFKLADLSLVSFIDRPVLAANAPNKFFDSLAAGTPVIVTNPGWTRAFVEAHGCGWYTPPSDAAALAGRIAWVCDHAAEGAEAGRRAEAVARAQFDRAVLAQRLERIFEQVAGRAKREP